jgi:hypothetical protein
MTVINISLPDDVAERYTSASDQDRLKLENMIRLFIGDVFTTQAGYDLRQLIHEASQEAQANGLTMAILEEILADES